MIEGCFLRKGIVLVEATVERVYVFARLAIGESLGNLPLEFGQNQKMLRGCSPGVWRSRVISASSDSRFCARRRKNANVILTLVFKSNQLWLVYREHDKRLQVLTVYFK
jgi:hypothetical protein